MSISKKEFNVRVNKILAIEKERIARTEILLSQHSFLRELEELAEHDPELARLCKVANSVHVAALKDIVTYISKKVEN